MSSIDFSSDTGRHTTQVVVGPCATAQPLHRLAAARREKGLSACTLARRLKTSVDWVKRQEQQYADLSLSSLHEWASALEVPAEALLIDSEVLISELTIPWNRALTLYRTAQAILEKAEHPNFRRMVTTLLEQLVNLVPELKDAGPLTAADRRRLGEQVQALVVRQLPENVFIKPIEGQE
jgi:transcriptional regulator with XRE-family HTH domain